MLDAKRDYDDAIALNPNSADNFFNRGNVYLSFDEPDFQRAHKDFDEALNLEKGNAKLYHAKGLAF
jgi:lipoprotein NlpI